MTWTDREVIVIGGGIAGLTAACELASRGHDVEVLEAAAEPGGLFGSDHVDGYVLARGPHSFPGSATAPRKLAESLGIAGRLVRSGAPPHRYLWHDGRLVRLPTGPASFITSRFLSASGKLRLLAEPLASSAGRRDGESVTARDSSG